MAARPVDDGIGRAVLREPVNIEHRPDPDGDADPGEIVWGWVPFDEDHSRGARALNGWG